MATREQCHRALKEKLKSRAHVEAFAKTAFVKRYCDGMLTNAGYTSLKLARGLDGQMTYVISPVGGAETSPTGGVIHVGQSFSSGPVVFDDGTTQNCSFVVTGVEVVHVPFGSFETFRLEENCTETKGADTSIISGTSWIHPRVGLVRGDYTLGVSVGVARTTFELEATNIPF